MCILFQEELINVYVRAKTAIEFNCINCVLSIKKHYPFFLPPENVPGATVLYHYTYLLFSYVVFHFKLS